MTSQVGSNGLMFVVSVALLLVEFAIPYTGKAGILSVAFYGSMIVFSVVVPAAIFLKHDAAPVKPIPVHVDAISPSDIQRWADFDKRDASDTSIDERMRKHDEAARDMERLMNSGF